MNVTSGAGYFVAFLFFCILYYFIFAYKISIKCKFASKIEDMANELEKTRLEVQDPELMSLADKIAQVTEEGKQALVVSINEISRLLIGRLASTF